VQARGLRLDVSNDAAPSVPLVANPLRFSATPISYERAPPCVGADSMAVLQSVLGLSKAQIDALVARGIVN